MVKKKKKSSKFFSYFPGYWAIWKCVFSLIYMNTITADVLPPRLCQLVAFGVGKQYKGAGYLGFCSLDPLGSLGTMLQTHAVAPITASDREVTTSWAAPELVQPRLVWARRWAGGEDTRPSWEGKDYRARSSPSISLRRMKKLTCVVRIDDIRRRGSLSPPGDPQEEMPG